MAVAKSLICAPRAQSATIWSSFGATIDCFKSRDHEPKQDHVSESGRLPVKCVILAGGLGTRLSEETHLRPKPMLEIGARPILWHIMKIYSTYGVNDFIVCCGYKGYIIKEYFANYSLHMSDVTFDMAKNESQVHQRLVEPWRVTLVDTGENSNTGGRLRAVADHIRNEEAFCFTYGDGVADIDLRSLIAFHREHGRLVTITAVQPPGRYGGLLIEGEQVCGFVEKPPGDGAWINGGFFVTSPRVLDYIDNPDTSWEAESLVRIAADGQLMAFKHSGFWQPMDTLRDMHQLNELWQHSKAPWMVW
jgi:glucose-1-phosphate cytidylyltransferase